MLVDDHPIMRSGLFDDFKPREIDAVALRPAVGQTGA